MAKSNWFVVLNHGAHRFAAGSRLSVCGGVVKSQNDEQLAKAPAEGCARCGGKQPEEQAPAQTGDSNESSDD